MRIAVFLLALVASASLLAVAHAQEPTATPNIDDCQALPPPSQLSPPNQLLPPAGLPVTGTGSISGQIVVQGPPVTQFELETGVAFVFAFFLIPADTPQPMDFRVLLDHGINPDVEGNFIVSNLADGDYLIVSLGLAEVVTPLPEIICVVGPSNLIAALPALRVIVANGQPVTGIEIVVRRLEPISFCIEDVLQLPPPSGLSPPNDVPFLCPPTTGTGPGPTAAERTGAYIGLGVAGLAALLLAGGVALRAWGRRLQ